MVLLTGWALVAAGALMGWFCRYFLIEPDRMQALCAAAQTTAWCDARAMLLAVTFPPRFGLVATVAAALCWVLRRRPAAALAFVALFAGGLGLHLYDTGWAASGVLLALLRLPRIGEEPANAREFTA